MPRSRHRAALASACFLITAVAVSGVFGSRTVLVSAQEGATFRAGTEIVRLDVRVTDNAGRPVGDVSPEEIEVIENGQRRPVRLFRHLRDASGDEQAAATSFEEVSANGGATAGHLYMLVFDQSHITSRNEQRVRQAAERFLLHTVKPGDAVALYGLPGPGPVLTFTSDFIKARLRLADFKAFGGRNLTPGLREYDAYRLARTDGRSFGDPALDRSGQAAGPDTFSEETKGAMASQVVASADTETHLFLRGLADVLRASRAIEGRKSVVVFSEGFVADNTTPQLEQVASAAALSQSVVYGVDLTRPAAADGISAAEAHEKRDALAMLAGETSGMLFSNGSDLDSALSTVAAQVNDYYLVGFEPAAPTAPADYHRVEVRVLRRGLVAHARSGYSTPPVLSPTTDR